MKRFFKTLCLATVFAAFYTPASAQLKKVYTDADSNNHIRKIHFYSPTEGYVAFTKWIGFTQDGGKTFSQKRINQVSIDGLPYGGDIGLAIDIVGVYAFDKNNLLAYGDISGKPCILYSNDGAANYTMTYQGTFDMDNIFDDVNDMCFVPNGGAGFAISDNKILKATSKSSNWVVVNQTASAQFYKIKFVTASAGFVAGEHMLLKTTDGGITWQPAYQTTDQIEAFDFISELHGWMTVRKEQGNLLYATKDGGLTWQLQNDGARYSVGRRPLWFVDDSVGYSLTGLYDVAKTSDGGKTWETLERDNAYEYLGYGHDDLFFYDRNTFWAGGDHGFLEATTTGSGATLPAAYFSTDLSALQATGNVVLINQSKENYTYKWFKNGAIFATTYNASYLSNKLTLDTIKLVVTHGAYSDTAVTLVDTRVDETPCHADFTLKIDTATATFAAADVAINRKHWWYFGDGTVDSTTTKPVHSYKAVGDFTVKHVVYNPVNGCMDSTLQTLTIIRTQNCFITNFTYVADSFYTNRLTFKYTISPQTELYSAAWGAASWNWGDAGTHNDQNPHVFDSAKTYNVCLFVTNPYTNCIAKLCKPVPVQMQTGCNADFQMQLGRTAVFNGRPQERTAGRRNTWILRNGARYETGNSTSVHVPLFKQGEPGGARYFDVEDNDCFSIFSQEINIDSIRQTIAHISYDSVTKCTDTVRKTFTVPRNVNVFIKAVPHPAFPQYVSFYAYTITNTGDSVPYSSRWRVAGFGGQYYAGGYYGASNKLTYTFLYPGTYNVAVAANSCMDEVREVYYINFNVPKVDSCPVFPPDFYVVQSATDKKTLTFYDRTANVNLSLDNQGKWFFGDGDSSTGLFPDHTYKTEGSYQAKLVYKNANGCSKESVQTIAVVPSCNFDARYTFKKDAVSPSFIHFTNRTTPDTAALRYLWYFGNGDTSTQKNPDYYFRKPGAYVVKLKATLNAACEKVYDTTIVISKEDSCNLNASFTYKADSLLPSQLQFVNTSAPASNATTYNWNFGDGTSGTEASPQHRFNTGGSYQISLTAIRDSFCMAQATMLITVTAADKVMSIAPNPTRSKVTVRFILSNAGLFQCGVYNQTGVLVKKIDGAGNAGANELKIPVANLDAGIYFIKIAAGNERYQTKFLKVN